MAHTVRDKSKLLSRVRRIQGQAVALEGLLASGSGCGDVLQQIAAIRGAVNGLMAAVLEGHLAEHLVDEPSLEHRQEELQDVLRVIRSYLK